VKGRLRVRKRALWALLAWAPQLSWASDQACTAPVLALVGKHFHLNDFSFPKPGLYPSQKNGGLVLAGVCQQWPAQKNQLITAFVYGNGEGGDQQLLMAMVDLDKKSVMASHQHPIEKDATTQYHSDSLRLDTASYPLSKSTKAFGLFANAFRERCTFDGGSDKHLTLFVVEGPAIRPVFQQTMSEWSYGPGNRCGGEDVPRIEINHVISVAPTTSNGLADLVLGTDGTDMAATFQYNGCHYVPRSQPPLKPCKQH